MDQPRLKAHFTAEVVGSDKVFLVAENRHYLVQGAAAVQVLPYLDGSQTLPQIAEALAGELSLPEVIFAVQKYRVMGHLGGQRADMPDDELAFWDFLGVDPAAARERSDAHHVTVVTLGSAHEGGILDALRANGITARLGTAEASPEGSAEALTVVVVDDYLDPALARLNAAFLATGAPWLLAKPNGMSVWLGPLMQRGRTGCWMCLAQRVDGNRQIERYLQTKRDDGAPIRTSRAALSSSRAVLESLLATHVARIIATGSSAELDGQMITLYIPTVESLSHALVRQPQCPACGNPSLATSRDPRVPITSGAVEFKSDGGYRVEHPSDTYRRLSKHVSPILGAVNNLSSTFDDDNGITFSYVAGHNFAMPGDNLDLLRRNLRGQSGGKGRTDIQARVSGICEAIERYSGVWRGDEPVTRSAYSDLGPDLAVNPNELLLFSDQQFANRKLWNKNSPSQLQVVPEPFRDDDPIDWTTGWSLTHARPRLIPSAYTWFGHPDLHDHFFCFSDANGNAAGNTREEAILQGFCELVERDSVALWWYQRARRPALDLADMHDPYVDSMRAHYARMGRSLWLLDMTSDIGVPAFAAVSHRMDHPVEDVLLGFGAHLDARLAAMRALTEVNQFLPSIHQRDQDGNTIYLETDAYTLWWWKNITVAAEPWLLPDEAAGKRRLSDFATIGTDDLGENVHKCVRLAGDVGLELIVVDQSRPDLDLAVVKVLAPGMRHFWRRLGPGRLYDVPPKLGWVDGPVAEDALNPHSVFF